MPKVHFVKAARKDNPAVQKGESYYYWSFYRGPKVYSKNAPRPSQLTQSKMSGVYAIQEEIEDYGFGDASTVEDFESCRECTAEFLREKAGELEEYRDEYQESCDNIRESFTESPTADECEEKAEQIQEYIDTIESMADEIGNVTVDVDGLDEDDENYEEELETAINAAIDEAQAHLDEAGDCPI